jgi:hypothetical protein
VTTTPGSGDLNAGKVVLLTVTFAKAVNVSGGTPTLTLNDNESASYVSGSGSTQLQFQYTVQPGDNVADLAVTGVNLNGSTILDTSGNPANLTGAVRNPPGILKIDTTAPTILGVSASPANADLGANQADNITVNFSEAVVVKGGTPGLLLSDGGTASYLSGSGTSSLTFRYNVVAGQNSPDLAVAGSGDPAYVPFNLNGATISDLAGNAANLTGANGVNPAGTLIIDTTRIRTNIASGTGQTVTKTGNGVVVLSKGNANLVFKGSNDVAFLGGSGATNATISDLSSGLQVYVLNGPGSGASETFSGFNTDTTGVVHLLNGIGGYTSVDQVISSGLSDDGHGGTSLSLGTGGNIDFAGVPLGHLQPSNFQIG